MKMILVSFLILKVGLSQQVNAQDISQAPGQSGMIPGVRYTTGATRTVGWEKQLIEGDPNLGRWHWSAMTNYTQSQYNRVPPGHFLQSSKSNSNPMVARKAPGNIYTKPINAPLPKNTRIVHRVNAVLLANRPEQHSTLSVGGRLVPQRSTRAAEARAYLQGYRKADSDLSGCLPVPSQADQQVYGRLQLH